MRFRGKSLIVQFRVNASNDANIFSEGGGINISPKCISPNNSIVVENCTFRNNTAVYGGAIRVIFQDLSSETTLHVKNCNFHNNYALERGGCPL